MILSDKQTQVIETFKNGKTFLLEGIVLQESHFLLNYLKQNFFSIWF